MPKVHYHGYTGIGGGYIDTVRNTFTTKAECREWLKREKEDWAEFAWTDDPNDPDRLRLFGNVQKMQAVGVEGGYGFYRESYVDRCDQTWEECEICQILDDGGDPYF